MEHRFVIQISCKDNVLSESPAFGLAHETKNKKHLSLCAFKTGDFSDDSNLTLCLLQQISQSERRHFQLSYREALAQRDTHTHKQTNKKAQAKTCPRHFVAATPCFYSESMIPVKVKKIYFIFIQPCSHSPFIYTSIYPITAPTLTLLALHCSLLML